MKRLISLFISFSLILFNFSFITPAKGADCTDAAKIFSSIYNVSFDFGSSGVATVSQKVSLKNLVNGCFASEYSLGINSADIKNVSGSDALGSLSTSIKKRGTTSTITARLNDEVIGKNQTVTFEIKYNVYGLSNKKGLTWEIIVPSVNTKEKINDYKLSVKVPKNYGGVFSINPSPEKISSDGKTTTLIFSKKNTLNNTILANFGSKQQISFKLLVSLENNKLLKKASALVIPPDSKRQSVLYTKIVPKPVNFETDSLGNLIAEFNPDDTPKNQAEIEGVVTLVGGDKQFQNKEVTGSQNLDIFLGGGKYIQVNNNLVQQKANELKTADKIYKFVTDLLKFDTKSYEAGKEKRKPVSDILKGDTVVTNQGFVDLFSSLSKAAGIPTRLVYGLVVSDSITFIPVFVGSPLNTNKLGVWLQIYDKKSKSWVSVDPTFGDVLGINYIQDNFLDRVALFYSVNGDEMGLLENISVTDENISSAYVAKEISKKGDVELKINYDQIFAGFPVSLKVKLKNKGGLTIHDPVLSVKTAGVDLVGKNTLTLEPIYPFETKEVTFKLRAGNLFGQKKGTVQVNLKGEGGADKFSKTKKEAVLINAFFTFGIQQVLLLFITVLLLAGFIFPKIRKAKST